jgi:hypothetical protein
MGNMHWKVDHSTCLHIKYDPFARSMEKGKKDYRAVHGMDEL